MTRKKTTAEFISEAKSVHKDTYSYEHTVYVNCQTPVIVTCKIHGDFRISPLHHLYGKQGCKYCGIERRTKKRTKTLQKFIIDSKKVHGEKYDYSRVEYVNSFKEVEIGCPVHGYFWQKPIIHTTGHGCYDCGNDRIAEGKLLPFDEYDRRVHEMYGDKYTVVRESYVGVKDKPILVICDKHGEFEIGANGFVRGLSECPTCGNDKVVIFNDASAVEALKNKFGDLYDYTKVKFIDMYSDVEVGCPYHGSVYKSLRNFLQGNNLCPDCTYSHSKDEFLEKAFKIHADRYDYSLVPSVIRYDEKLQIKCKKHGVFMQTAFHHFYHGCPVCSLSKLERKVWNRLRTESIDFICQKTFDWLGRGTHSFFRLDFYVPKANIGIECQGIQHFKDVDFFDRSVDEQKEDDRTKQILCKEHGIDVIYFYDGNEIQAVDDYWGYITDDLDKIIDYVKGRL